MKKCYLIGLFKSAFRIAILNLNYSLKYNYILKLDYTRKCVLWWRIWVTFTTELAGLLTTKLGDHNFFRVTVSPLMVARASS